MWFCADLLLQAWNSSNGDIQKHSNAQVSLKTSHFCVSKMCNLSEALRSRLFNIEISQFSLVRASRRSSKDFGTSRICGKLKSPRSLDVGTNSMLNGANRMCSTWALLERSTQEMVGQAIDL